MPFPKGAVQLRLKFPPAPARLSLACITALSKHRVPVIEVMKTVSFSNFSNLSLGIKGLLFNDADSIKAQVR